MSEASQPAGETLEFLLQEALGLMEKKVVETDYERYRTRAIQWRGKRKKLPDHELADPRFFEMRASGLNPDNADHRREHFFHHGDDDRRELVTFSRKAKTRYVAPAEPSQN